MKPAYMIVAILVILLLVWFLQPKKSNMAVFNAKKPGEKCPEGWSELTSEICTKEA
jgi:hypothetical protein